MKVARCAALSLFLALAAAAAPPVSAADPTERLHAAARALYSAASLASRSSGTDFHPRDWERRWRSLLDQMARQDADPDADYLLNYEWIWAEIGAPAEARAALRPHALRLLKKAFPASGSKPANPEEARARYRSAKALARLLGVMLVHGMAERRERSWAMRLARDLPLLGERCAAFDQGAQWATEASRLLIGEAAVRYRTGSRTGAATLFARHRQAWEHLLRTFWKAHDARECWDYLKAEFLYVLEWYPPPQAEPWREESAASIRRLVQALIRDERAGGRAARAAEGQRVLALLEYYYINLGVSDPTSALYRANEAVEAARRLPPGTERAKEERQAAMVMAVIAAKDGDHAVAAEAWSRALVLARADPAPPALPDLFNSLMGLGSAELALGALDAGASHLREAEALLPPHLEEELIRRPAPGERVPDEGPLQYEGWDSLHAAAGDYFSLLGDANQARKRYERAISRIRDRRVYRLTLVELRRAALEARGLAPLEHPETRSAYRWAAQAKHTADPWVRQAAWQAEARLRELEGDPARALDAWRRAEAEALLRQNRQDLAFIRVAMGGLMAGSGGDLLDARRRFEQVLAYAEEAGQPFLQWQALLGRGRLLERQGQPERALDDYRAAADLAARLRERSALAPTDRARMLPASAAVYYRAARLELRRSRPHAAYRWVQRYKGGVLRSMLLGTAPRDPPDRSFRRDAGHVFRLRLAMGELAVARQDRKGGGGDPALASRLRVARRAYLTAAAGIRRRAAAQPPVYERPPVEVAQLVALARRAQVTLADYLATDEGLLIFVIDGEGLYCVEEPVVRPREIALAARRVLDMYSDRGSALTGSAPTVLYDRLLRPLRRHLSPGRPLVLVPDGPMHGIPFAALRAKGRYLIEERPVAVAPSVDVFYHSFRSGTAAGGAMVLARSYREAGTPLQVSRVTRASYGPLAASRAEGEAAARALPALLWRDSEAHRKHFLEALRGKLAWFAGHVHYDRSDPANSALILSGRDASDPLSVRDLVSALPRPLPGLEMVVLSGCDSARGQAGAGEGLVGLAWALQRGGARSVVGCGWEVDDAATAALMGSFAVNLRRMGRAEALRQAQLSILRRGGRYSHPYYWAAPVLIGRTDPIGPIQPPRSSWLLAVSAGGLFAGGIAAAIRRRRPRSRSQA